MFIEPETTSTRRKQCCFSLYKARKLRWVTIFGFYVLSHFNRHPVTWSLAISICYWLNYIKGQI